MLTFDFEMTFVLLLQINETSRWMSGLIFRCIQQVHVILLSQKRVNAMSAVNTARFTCKRIRGKMDRRPYERIEWRHYLHDVITISVNALMPVHYSLSAVRLPTSYNPFDPANDITGLSALSLTKRWID